MRPRKRIVQFVSVLVIYLSLFRVLVPVSEAHAGGKGGVLPGSDPGRLSFNVPSDRGSISSASYGDGTVRKGSVGRYDAKDFRLIDGRMGEPRFAAESTPDHVGPTTSCSDGWYDGPPVNGIDGFVDAIAVDGAGNVYAGGSFRVAGSSIVNNIAKWNGSSWSALSTGTNAEVHSIAVSGTDIFVGGNFTTAGGIAAKHVAKWNGSSWSPVGTGLEHPAFDLKISGTTVYAGTGSWDPVSQSGEGYVSMWNGAGWSDLGPQIGFIVDSIAVSGKAVYAVGSGQIVKWNGSDWFDLSSGFDGEFHDVVVSGGDVYSAGHRYIGGGAALGFAARWNGSGWTELGSGMTGSSSGAAHSIAVSGSDVYVAGYFATAGGIQANGAAKWNGSSWSAIGSWGGYPQEVAVSGGDVYFGGWQFSSPGRVPRAEGIAKWNGASWSALGSGIYSAPSVLTASGTEVYGAGYFTTDGGNTVSRVAKWNGSGWTPLGPEPSGPSNGIAYLTDIAVLGTDVYVSGYWNNENYQFLGGFVFKWNGSGWSDLGWRMDAVATGFGVSGTDIYAGGYIWPPGVGFVTKWNGSTWSQLGPGMNGGVAALGLLGTDLYAGGSFSTVGGTPVNCVVKWNGSGWSSLGGLPIDPLLRPSTPNAPADWFHGVDKMLISGAEIYVAGGWWDDYGAGAGFVSKWNGGNWSELPRLCCSPVYAIAASGAEVYAGGAFTAAGGTLVNRIAKWNGTGWSALGTGTNGDVRAIALSGSDVFVGGYFTTAGCHISANFARYSSTLLSEVSVSGRVTTAGGRGIGNARVTLTNSKGLSRITSTSAFGYYQFSDVATGQTYTISVRSKRYLFQSRTVELNAELANVDFVALE